MSARRRGAKSAQSAAQDAQDTRFMGTALKVAEKGRPSPNPHVGAVLVKGGKVVAKGYHRRAGEAHAEVAAISAAGRRARGATLYVSFEPCNHFGRTGPCTDAILAAGIERVVIGCADPAPHVPGATAKLRRAGLEVRVGVREAEARRLIADFEKHITTGLPFVTLKAAVTLDGYIAAASGDSKWITGEAARRHAHRLRDRSDAVLVGIGTVLADDPALTVRHLRGVDPRRVVVDSSLRTPANARLLTCPAAQPPLIFHGPMASDRRAARLRDAGADLVKVPLSAGGLDLRRVLRELGKRDVVRLLVEGGSALHGTLLDKRLADRAAIFIAPKILGDSAGIPLASGKRRARMSDARTLEAPRTRRFGDDLYVEGEL